MNHQFTPRQRAVAAELSGRYFRLKDGPSSAEDRQRHLSLFNATAAFAFALYSDLQHHGYLIEFSDRLISASGSHPDQLEFFCQLHVLEDLLGQLLPLFQPDE